MLVLVNVYEELKDLRVRVSHLELKRLGGVPCKDAVDPT